MKYVTKIINEEIDGRKEVVVLFPKDLIDKLNFIENEYLVWEVHDKVITITRTNIIDARNNSDNA